MSEPPLAPGLPEPYTLIIRFRQQGPPVRLDLETEGGDGDTAQMAPPFGADLPLLLRALAMARQQPAASSSPQLAPDEYARLGALGLVDEQHSLADIHVRVGRALLAELTRDPQALAVIAQARSEARAAGHGLELALRFMPAVAPLADLPWELLWDEQVADRPLLLTLGLAGACTRYLTVPQQRPPLPIDSLSKPLTVLFASTHAPTRSSWPMSRRRILESALAPDAAGGLLQALWPEPPLTVDALLALVAEHRPAVLSIAAPYTLRDGTAHLLLDAPGGGQEWVPADRLAAIAQFGVQVVVLCQAHDAPQGDGVPASPAMLLGALSVPALVSLPASLNLTAAAQVQATLLRGLASGQSAQQALTLARATLYVAQRDIAAWAAPTLMIAARNEEPLRLVAPSADAITSTPVELARAGARRGARRFAEGVAGTAALTFLAASSVLPLLTGGFSSAVIVPLLAGLGGNALSGWLMSWAEQNLHHSGWLEPAAEAQTLVALAAALERRLATDDSLRDDLAAMAERTAMIPAALEALGDQVDAQSGLLLDLHDRLTSQEALLQALRADLRRGDLIQGRLHHHLLTTLDAQTTTLLSAYSAGTAQLTADVRAVLVAVQSLRDELRAPGAALPEKPSGGISLGGASIGTVGTLIAGDNVGQDKVLGNKHEYHGPVTINPPPPSTPTAAEQERETHLRAYLGDLIRECNQLTLADVDDLDPDQRTVPLASVYIRLEVASTVKPQQEGKKGDQERQLEEQMGRRERQQTALEAVVTQRQVVLLGPPGSGKSTFVNHLAYCLARAALGDTATLADLGESWPHGAVCPIRVVLREFAAWIAGQKRLPRADQRLWRYLRDDVGLGKDLAAYLQAQAQQRHAILLLDGLDEVPTAILPRLHEAIAAVRPVVPLIVVTCRVLDYADPERQLADWPAEPIIPLSNSLQQAFIERWYAVLKEKQRRVNGDPDRLRESLTAQVRNRVELQRMAGNPLLLTMMAQLHAFRELPAKRVLLYSECIDLLLRRWRPQAGRPDLRELLRLPEWSVDDTLRLLDRLGYVTHMRAAPPAGKARAEETDLPEQQMIATAEQYFRNFAPAQDSWRRAAEFSAYISQFSNGVLQRHGPSVFRFPHRTFQEYLAARRLIGQGGWEHEYESTLRRRAVAVAGQAQWREALLMAVSQLVLNTRPDDAVAMVEAIFHAHAAGSADRARHAVLAGELLSEIGRAQVLDLGPSADQLWKEVVAAQARLLQAEADQQPLIDVPVRIRAGFALGQLGDPRPGVLSLEPDWCDIPAGPFLLGSKPDDPGSYDRERPQRTVDLPVFRIARYPVSNAQWRQFVEAGGYAERQWWSAAGWALIEKQGWRAPRWWDDPQFNSANQPVVGVTWYEATAYCRWLSAQLGYDVRLPSEAEWEKAARGSDGRTYPWGNVWEDTKANTGPASHQSTTPVGGYPDGASPCGAFDMSGNVWEWTATPWAENYESSDGTIIDTEGAEENYVWRGGAWGDLGSAPCAARIRNRPSDHNNFLGVRVVAALTRNEP